MTSAPYFIGKGTSSSASTTVISTIVAPSAAGDTIVVSASISSSGTISGVTDSAGNIYTQKASNTAENPTYVWVSPGLTGGSGGGPTGAVTTSITVSWTSPAGTQIAAAVGCSGLLLLDQNPATTFAGSGTAASITSSGLSGFPEACVAVVVNGDSGGGSGTWASGWTPPLLAPTIAGSLGQYMSVAAQVASSNTAVTAGFTVGASSKWCMALLTFEYQVTISPSTLPGGTQGAAYSQTLTATGGTGSFTWSVISGSLPPGLGLSGATITGTPTATGTYSFTVQATDGASHSATQPLSITIAAGPFPDVPLGVRTELQLGGTWTDITGRAKQSGTPLAITTITGGRQNQTTTATPTTASPRWNNRDGDLDPDNPLGPYYGLLQQNTPCRISIPRPDGLSRLRLENSTQAAWASTAAIQNTTTLDVRVDMEASSYLPGIIASQGLSPLWYLQRYGDGTVALWWIDNSAQFHGQTTGVPVPTGRIMLRAVLTLSTGAVSFYTAPTMGGTQTLLASFAGAGATTVAYVSADSLYCGGTAVTSPYPAWTGSIYEMQIWDGSTLKADPQFYTQSPGTTSFTDSQSNTWTVVAPATIDNRSYRAHLECSSLPGEWDPRGGDVWVPVTLSGVLRRLQAGNAQVKSVMRRLFTNWPSFAGGAVTGYWPAEDPQGASFIASGLPGGTPMSFTGSPSFQGQTGSLSSDTDFPASAGLPVLNGSSWSAVVPPVTGTPPANALAFFTLIPSGGDTNGGQVAQMYTAGTIAVYEITYGTAAGGTLFASIYNSAGAQIGSTRTVATGVNGQPVLWLMWLSPDGSGVDYGMAGSVVSGSGLGFGGFYTAATSTIGQFTAFRLNVNGQLSGTKLGQAATGTWTDTQFTLGTFGQSDPYTSVSAVNPVTGWTGEPAGARFARLCAENSLQGRVYGYPDITQLMGPQPIDTLANLLQETEDADRGIIYEPRECLGAGYRTLKSLCGQAPALSLDYGLGQVSPPLKPSRDDLTLRNDAVVTRNNGSTAQVQITSGPLAVQTVGDYQQSLTVYVENDSQLASIAGWIAHVGTAPGKRYPSFTVDMASTAAAMQALQQTVASVRMGDHLQVTDTPQPLLPPGSIDQLAWGWAETLGDKAWRITWNTVPESPYEVAVGGTGATDSAHGDTAGSQLNSSASSSATSLSVATISGPLWTTSAADFPFDVLVSGERITVTNITGSSSPQTFTVTRSVNGVVKAQSAAAAIALFHTPVAALT